MIIYKLVVFKFTVWLFTTAYLFFHTISSQYQIRHRQWLLTNAKVVSTCTTFCWRVTPNHTPADIHSNLFKGIPVTLSCSLVIFFAPIFTCRVSPPVLSLCTIKFLRPEKGVIYGHYFSTNSEKKPPKKGCTYSVPLQFLPPNLVFDKLLSSIFFFPATNFLSYTITCHFFSQGEWQ